MWTYLYTLGIFEVHAAETKLYFAELSSSESMWESLIRGVGHTQLLWIIVGALMLAMLLVPRLMSRLRGLVPILGIVAFMGAAAVLPWALDATMSEQRIDVSSDVSGRPVNIEMELRGSDELVISWETEKEVVSAVEYGIDPKDLDLAAFTNDPLVKKLRHEARITRLVGGKTYYFELVSGGRRFGNDGEPLIFKMPE